MTARSRSTPRGTDRGTALRTGGPVLVLAVAALGLAVAWLLLAAWWLPTACRPSSCCPPASRSSGCWARWRSCAASGPPWPGGVPGGPTPGLAQLDRVVDSISPRITRRLLETFAAQLPAAAGRDARLDPLTSREREVLALVARGWSNAEIAADLVLSELTVTTSVGRILAETGLRDRTQAAVLAYEARLVTPS